MFYRLSFVVVFEEHIVDPTIAVVDDVELIGVPAAGGYSSFEKYLTQSVEFVYVPW